MRQFRYFFAASLILLILSIMATQAVAVAPSPETLKEWKIQGMLEQKIANWVEFKKQGGCAAEDNSVFKGRPRSMNLAAANAVDTVRLLVVMVEFPDWRASWGLPGTAAGFDSLLFSEGVNSPGSMTDYYLENSYGQFYIKADIFGWYMMPNKYKYYVGTNSGLGFKSRELARVAADSARNHIPDFTRYDIGNGGDGVIDGFIIIHAGEGAETAGANSGDHLWSHKSTLSITRIFDGVRVSAYTLNPEENGNNKYSTIGVYCHEYGHILGLPDLYDINPNAPSTSDGLGYWSLMAIGNYLGSGRWPAHLDAWCKSEAGFLNLIDVSTNFADVEFPAVEYDPVAYRISDGITGSGEYWVVENRQKFGFDQQMRGEGLCIYHVDESVSQNNPNHYKVAMEQADGLNELAFGNSAGDAGDPWPNGTDVRSFNEFSNPNSSNYFEEATRIAVWDISDSDSIMTADLDVVYSRPWIELRGTDSIVFSDADLGDGDGIIEPGETIRFYCQIQNLMKRGYMIHSTLSTSNTDIQFITNDVAWGVGADPYALRRNDATPIEFTLADTIDAVIDSFYLTITIDSMPNIPGSSNFSFTFGIEQSIGSPQVLIVDDDNGDNYEQRYTDAIYNAHFPNRVWNIQSSGSPTVSDLSKYKMVFWHTGNPIDSPRTLDSNNITAMKGYLDQGGNLFLSSVTGTFDLWELDSAFVKEYFKTRVIGEGRGFTVYGIDGNPIGDGDRYKWDPFHEDTTALLEPIAPAQAAFDYGNLDVCGMTYSGDTYRTILLTFSAESIRDDFWSPLNTLIARSAEFFGGLSVDVYDGQPFTHLPQTFLLDQNYPNPFNPSTSIMYTLKGSTADPVDSHTTLSVFNLLGRKVRTLVDQVQGPGTYRTVWDGTNNNGQRVASGLYLYRLSRGGETQTKKMILLK